eukprot:EC714260.1.p1 GENE.EC714260.1~~EC714260.1.p1  ORF type:complete len:106 (+),score=6.50 EC714260.1:22-318(+)
MNEAELDQLIRDFQIMPSILQLLEAYGAGEKQDQVRKIALALRAQIARCRQSLEELPGGSLSSAQQSDVYEYQKRRLLRSQEIVCGVLERPPFNNMGS